MKRPARAKSLLVDYSKSRASTADDEDLEKTLNLKDLVLLGDPSSSSSRGGGTSVTTAEETEAEEEEEESHHTSNSSMSLPDLAPLPTGAAGLTAKKPASVIPCADAVPEPEAMAAPASIVNNHHRQSRRARLRGTRQYQSMSNLKVHHHSSSDNDNDNDNEVVLSFSLRRRTTKTIREDPENIGSAPPPLRSKTWDNITTGSSCDRFHNSLGNLNVGDLPLDETSEPDAPTAKPTTPAQNRRSMLVRHSSVSALNQSSQHTTNPIAMAPLQRHHSSSRRQLMSQMSSKNVVAATAEKKENDILPKLPSSIDIVPRSARAGSQRDLGRHSLRGGSSHHPRRAPHLTTAATTTTTASRQAAKNHHRDAPMGSASSHSFFHAPERHASSSGTILASPPPSRRDLLQRQRSSRRHVLSASRSMSSKGSFFHQTASSTTCTTGGHAGQRQGGDMDDSSHFVTGSRIRRGLSARHLFANN